MKKRIVGTGCCLLDFLYTDRDFQSEAFRSLQSRRRGDGGLTPGELVFSADLAAFAGADEAACLARLTDRREPDEVNLGGPGIVASVHAAQILTPQGWTVDFTGVWGDDPGSRKLRELVAAFPLGFGGRALAGRPVSSTTVLSDPRACGGAGERTFVHRLGAAEGFDPAVLGEEFFDASLFLWGGTALVPPLHRSLTGLLQRARRRGGRNIVGTVYDFLNESRRPGSPWPLGDPEEPAYPWIDLLIADQEEAYRLSGTRSLDEAARFFREAGCASFIITRGAQPLYLFSAGGFCGPREGLFLPVSPFVDAHLQAHPELRGDTTGCGDNFMGGVLVSLVRQMEKGDGPPDLVTAAVEGLCSGGLALYSRGGCRKEAFPGEKAALLEPIRRDYLANTLPEVLR